MARNIGRPSSLFATASRFSYLESIVETVREPLIVLDKKLRVKTANWSFYRTFQVMPKKSRSRAKRLPEPPPRSVRRVRDPDSGMACHRKKVVSLPVRIAKSCLNGSAQKNTVARIGRALFPFGAVRSLSGDIISVQSGQ